MHRSLKLSLAALALAVSVVAGAQASAEPPAAPSAGDNPWCC